MFFKSYKVYNNYVELRLNIAKKEEFDNFIQLLKLFNLTIGNLICTCSYDKDLINIVLIENEVNIKVVKTAKKNIRTIHLKEIDVVINSIQTLEKLLKLSNDYDALLIFKSMKEFNSKTFFVINDNGHDYIRFDKKKYEKKEIKLKISQLLND